MFIKRGDGKILTVIKSTSEDDVDAVSPELDAFAKDQLERAKKAVTPAAKPGQRPASIKSPNTEK